MTTIDRIDNRGNIREHIVDQVEWTGPESKRPPTVTLCGLPMEELGRWQAAAGNLPCRRCLWLADLLRDEVPSDLCSPAGPSTSTKAAAP